MRVLLIEDDVMIGHALRTSLGREGMAVDWVQDGVDGGEAATAGDYNVVLLDLTLPGQSGLDVLQALRRAGNRIPVLVITARDDVDDRVRGLDLGADDYVVKPFATRELVARIRAVMRRQSGAAESVLQAGELSLNLADHRLSWRGITVELSAREFALMRTFIERPGVIFSRSELELRLYGWGDEVESNAIDVLIHSVRKKLGKEAIRNVRGAGWMVLRDGP